MSQQDTDDDSTVIRPRAGGPGVAPLSGMAHTAPLGSPEALEDNLSLRTGTRVAEFEILQRIGEGGFSIVYLARDHSLERTVALKEYMPSSLATRVGTTQVQARSQRYRDTFDAGLKSFINEAKLLAQFDHPSLVKVYRFWEANGTAYMVMPFYQGVTVKDAVRSLAAPPDEAWLYALLVPLTEALGVIHAERCFHRDIAPDNVMLLAGTDKPLLLDFGAARRVIGDMTQGLTVILKAGYAPVEQYAEIPGMKQGPWTDVYALAAVVYWAITGSTPPPSVGRMMSDSFVPLARCAAGRYSLPFLEAIDRALAVRPEQRTQSIDALRQDLGIGLQAEAPRAEAAPAWTDSEATVIRPVGPRSVMPTATRGEQRTPTRGQQPPPTVSKPVPPVDAAAQPLRRRLLMASAVGLSVVGAGAWWWLRPRPAQAPPSVPAPVPPSTPPSLSSLPPTPAPAPVQAPAAVPAPASPPAAEASPAIPRTEPTRPPGEQVAAPPESRRSSAEPTAPVPTPAPEPRPEGSTAALSRPSAPAAPRPSQEARDTTPTPRAPKPPVARANAAPTPSAATEPVANSAECARILQRLSLGESSPELVDRLKALKCR